MKTEFIKEHLRIEKLDELNLDDLSAAISQNSVPVPEEFRVRAEILSDCHDEGEYFWLIEDRKGLFYVIDGSHDYTGWDCQSDARISKGFKSLDDLHLHVAAKDNQNRPVRQMLLDLSKRRGKIKL